MVFESELFTEKKTRKRSTKSHETTPKHSLVILGFRVVSCDLVDRSSSQHEGSGTNPNSFSDYGWVYERDGNLSGGEGVERSDDPAQA